MIRFEDVHKRFGEKVVLDGFSLEVPDRATTVLLGASGAGKSITLKLVVGLLAPDAGQVEVDGQVVDRLDDEGLRQLRRGIGFVFQSAALFDSLSVEENIALGLRQQRLDGAEIEARVASSLETVGLGESAAAMPSELSGGMRKRVGIARAIALRPRYILWDEPTAGLDPVTSATIDRLIRRTTEELGATSLVVTHELRSVFAIADRIAMLHQGRLQWVGPASEVRTVNDPVLRQFIEGRPA